MRPWIKLGGAAFALTALAVAAGAGGPAASAQAPLNAREQAAALRDLSACPPLTDDAARLACYDKAARALLQAETEGEVVVVDRQQAQEVRRQSFGFQIPSLNVFSRSGRPKGTEAETKKEAKEEVDRASVTIAAVGRTGDGKLTLTTNDGAFWVQTDNFPVNAPPQKGAQINIVKGAIGGYFCDVSRYQSVRCERRR